MGDFLKLINAASALSGSSFGEDNNNEITDNDVSAVQALIPFVTEQLIKNANKGNNRIVRLLLTALHQFKGPIVIENLPADVVHRLNEKLSYAPRFWISAFCNIVFLSVIFFR